MSSVDKLLELVKAKNKINSPIAFMECDICHFAYAIDLTKGENYIKKLLKEHNWHVVNNKIYCPQCYKQYKEISDIAKLTVPMNNNDNKQNNNKYNRPDKYNYYLNIAKEVSSRSTCLRKHYGCVIVKNDIIISTGYNGAPRQTKNCIDLDYCRREQMNIPRGQCYELCRSVHAEMNAIINAKREEMIDSILYLYGCDINGDIIENLDSCQMCKKIIINAGIKKVVFARSNNNYSMINVIDWVVNDETLTDKMGY